MFNLLGWSSCPATERPLFQALYAPQILMTFNCVIKKGTITFSVPGLESEGSQASQAKPPQTTLLTPKVYYIP
jgi:hypothetical protein